MINQELLNPTSIAIISASNNISNPGGKILKNILDGEFKGEIYTVNFWKSRVQGIICY